MRRLLFILFLLPMLGFSQALQRQFFTTNTAPNVVVTAGTNAFITFSLVGQQRTYRVDTPASGTATNIVWPVQGTNVYLTTNGLAIVIDVPSPLIPWQAITNITSIQIPAAAITNAPWSLTGQTNLALTIAGTNVFVHSVTNLGVTTYTIDVPLQPQQTNWPWQSITNIATVQIPYSAITNPPAAGGQTNLALVVSGTNVFVSSVTNLGVTTFTIDVPASGSGQTNLALVIGGTNAFVHSTTNSGVTTFTVDGPAVRTNWAITDITNSLNLTNWALLGTNLFLPVAGGTSTGPQLTTSSSTNAPAGNEFVTGAWVRGLLNEGFFEYASTNIISGTNADSPNQFLYEFHMQHIPDSATRVWPNTFLTNGGYVGSVSTTNTFQSIAGQILVNAYIGLSSGGGDALSLKPEIYLSTDRSNWYGDFDCSAQAITPGITQLYSFVVSFPAQTATNPAGFYIERRLKVTSKGGSPTMYFLVGTNAISGTNSASHISINAAPVQGGTFSGVFIGNGYGLTNIPDSAISNSIAVGATAGAILGATGANTPSWIAPPSVSQQPGVIIRPQTSVGSATWSIGNALGQRRSWWWEAITSPSLSGFGDGISLVGAAAVQIGATATTHNKIIVFTPAVNANTNGWASSANNVPNRNGFYYFQCAVTNTSNCRAWVVMSDASSGGAMLNRETNTAGHYVGFLGSSTNWANWQFVTCNGSTWTFTDTGIATGTTATSFAIILNAPANTLTSAVGMINGSLVATNTTTLPNAALRPVVGVATLADAVAGLEMRGAYGECAW